MKHKAFVRRFFEQDFQVSSRIRLGDDLINVFPTFPKVLSLALAKTLQNFPRRNPVLGKILIVKADKFHGFAILHPLDDPRHRVVVSQHFWNAFTFRSPSLLSFGDLAGSSFSRRNPDRLYSPCHQLVPAYPGFFRQAKFGHLDFRAKS